MKIEQQLRETIRLQGKSDKTADAYWGWVKQFLLFAREKRGQWVHRYIMGVTDQKTCVDHINGDPLDNRRSNLRVCKQGENMRNYRHAWGKEGIRGVMQTRTGKYRARIRYMNKLYHIGTFDTQHDASIAYAFASSLLHGDFGSLPGHEKFLNREEPEI